MPPEILPRVAIISAAENFVLALIKLCDGQWGSLLYSLLPISSVYKPQELYKANIHTEASVYQMPLLGGQAVH